MASTLNERFGDILRAARGDVSVSDLELKIGEAQQLYPEIWRHLDEARAELAARGLATAGYDAIRATEAPGTLGVTRIDFVAHQASTLAILLDSDADQPKKTATFNLEGFRKAKQAAKELMAAMPEVDWAGLARAEAREIAAAGSLRTGSYKRTLIGAAVIAALFAGAVGAWKLVDGAATRERRREHAARIEQERAERAALFQPKIDQLEAELTARPCTWSVGNRLYRAFRDAGRPDDARAFKARFEDECRRPREPMPEPDPADEAPPQTPE